MSGGEYIDAVWHRWWIVFFGRLRREGWVPGGCRASADLGKISASGLESVVRYVHHHVMRCPDVEWAVRKILRDRRDAGEVCGPGAVKNQQRKMGNDYVVKS